MATDRLLPLKRTLGLVESTSSISRISKVPNELRRLKKEAYSPQIVSIGPYHHGKGNLPDMEKHKLQYVLHLLHRTTTPVETLDDCGQAIQNLVQRVRGCYAEDIRRSVENKLLQILVVDGCFIFEMFYRRAFPPETNLNDPLPIMLGWSPERLNIPPEHSLTSLALSFFHLEMDDMQKGMSTEPNHLLDLLHKVWLPRSDMGQSGSETREFDPNDGVIKIPPLSIDAAESLLRNFIALEQCDISTRTFHISSYALMMRSLIRSSVDVKLLQQKGIIISDLELGGSDWIAIDGVCKNVVFSERFFFNKLCTDVREYRASRFHWQRQKAIWTVSCHRYLAELKRDYFSNPWKIIAFLAALALLILTGLGTGYTVRSYYNGSSELENVL
ncbi:hypothetical protein CK203_083075 [Vitis vinifera]|uniref:Uncharacterized protein n=1 Tax=Vitis vinifera TaxID=29760 RepID=A0A438E9W4_VITVI|nr:hypothetical protein CK203_083075 [Vitis vinifera]